MSIKTNSHTLPVGSLLNNKYRIEKILGQGGFGITYMATHQVLQKKVAIKELFLNTQVAFCSRNELDTRTVRPHFNNFDEFKNRFLEEARILAKFTGEKGIVQISDNFSENDTVYFVMDFVEGVSLSELVQQKGRLSESEAVSYAILILEALKTVHKNGILHRDIKPDNVIIRAQDNQPVLIDFGIAREYVDNEVGNHTIMFSVGYSAPEQQVAKFKRTASMDLYSVGAILYYCLTGQRPQTPSEIAVDGYISVSSINPEVSPAIEEIIQKAMQQKIENRFQSSTEMIKALASSRQIEDKATPSSTSEKTVIISSSEVLQNKTYDKKGIKRPMIIIASIIIIASALAIIIWQQLTNKNKKPEKITAQAVAPFKTKPNNNPENWEVFEKEGKYGFRHSQTKEVMISPIYERAYVFRGNTARVVKNKKPFYINEKGDCVKGCD
jgi:serine/threonine protein kinase